MYKEKNMTYFGEWNEKKLFQFIKDHTTNRFIKLNKEKWNSLFHETNSSFLLMLIADPLTHDFELEQYQAAAKNTTNQIISTYCAMDQIKPFANYLYNYLPAKESQIPMIFLIDKENGNETNKIIMNEEISFDSIVRFVDAWWRKYHKEEEKIEINDGFNELVVALNNSNLKATISDENKDFVIINYNKTSENFKKIRSKWNEYANLFKENKKLVFTAFDQSKDIETDIKEKIVIVSNKHKKNKIIYEGDIENQYKFVAFIKKNFSFDWVDIEKKNLKDDL